MIAVDTNILVYAFNDEAPEFEPAVTALRRLAVGHAAWAVPVFVIGEFLRVVTNPRGPLTNPARARDAMHAVDALLASPSVRLLSPGRRFPPLHRALVTDTDPRGNEVFDAHIAAVCLEPGATTVLTNDTRFRLFPGITIEGLR